MSKSGRNAAVKSHEKSTGSQSRDIIFGLDPGSRVTGYGVIEVTGDLVRHVDHGIIRLDEKAPLSERLRCLHVELENRIGRFSPSTVVIEKIFFGKSADSAFKLGHARGVALMTAAEHGVLIAEYAARQVKKAVTGHGAADKELVQLWVQRLLSIRLAELAFDASDALSLAICHARLRDSQARLKKMMESAL
jgi:crossover junction endodeoxyribonuclease RuvC